jgi:hypothetical protein
MICKDEQGTYKPNAFFTTSSQPSVILEPSNEPVEA